MPIPLQSYLPHFSLPSTEGTVINTEDFSNLPCLLVIFTCNHCPYAQAYNERLNELYIKFVDKGLQILAINSNDAEQYPEDSFENMIAFKEKAGFKFPYLIDKTQQIARSFMATHTPECFLFDKQRRLVYYGKIDDNWREPEKVKNRYLSDAVFEILAGKEVSFPETFAIGCTIKWLNP